MDISGKSFYKLIKFRFSDTWDEVSGLPYLTPSPTLNENVSTLYKYLDKDKILGVVLIALFSFYAGRILEDGRGTNLYTGPADHRAKTLLTKYVNDATCLTNSNTDDKGVRKTCYEDLKHIGFAK